MNKKGIEVGDLVYVYCESEWIICKVLHLNLESKTTPNSLQVRPLKGQGFRLIAFFVDEEEYVPLFQHDDF
jgi:hypothetical protein